MSVARSIISFMTLLACASSAMANNNNNNNVNVNSVTTIQQPKKPNRNWSGLLNASRSTGLIDFQDGTRSDGMDYSARYGYKFADLFTARIQAGYSQDLKYPENNDFSDTSISVSATQGMSKNRVLFGGSVAGVIPTSKDSKVRQNLQTALSATMTATINPFYLVPGLSIAGALGVGKNFHQYETAVDGRVNNAYSARQTLSVGYEFSSGLSLSAEFIHRNTWSYQNVMRDSFEFGQEVGWAFNPTFSIAVGHTNVGSSLRPNGVDSNVGLYNDNTSTVYASAAVIF